MKERCITRVIVKVVMMRQALRCLGVLSPAARHLRLLEQCGCRLCIRIFDVFVDVVVFVARRKRHENFRSQYHSQCFAVSSIPSRSRSACSTQVQ